MKKLTLHLPFGLPSHLLSYHSKTTIQKRKKGNRNKSHKVFTEGKQAHVGLEPSKSNQSRWEWHHNIYTPSLHLVPFCLLCTPQNSLHVLSLFICIDEQDTQLCSLHSLTHKRRPISAMFSSNKISQHKLQYAIQTQHCSCTPQFLHTLKTDRIWHAQPHWSHPQHKSLSMHINIHYTPTTTHPTAFHNPPLHTTNKHKLYLCKWQQNGTSIA